MLFVCFGKPAAKYFEMSSVQDQIKCMRDERREKVKKLSQLCNAKTSKIKMILTRQITYQTIKPKQINQAWKCR